MQADQDRDLALLAETEHALADAAANPAATPPEHTSPPAVLDPNQDPIAAWGQDTFDDPAGGYQELNEWGVRAYGNATAGDYPVIAARAGDPSRWGFTHDAGGMTAEESLQADGGYGKLAGGDIATIGPQAAAFIRDDLDDAEREALDRYCGPKYGDINSTYTGSMSTATGRMYIPALDRAFTKARDHNLAAEPATLVRGAGLPDEWPDAWTSSDIMDTVYPVGSRIETSCIASTSTNPDVAEQFADDSESDTPYVMAIRARGGLAVNSIGIPGEDEVLVPPGTRLRVVDHADNGVAGLPTVYLVGEDLVAEAQTEHDT